MLKKFIIGMLLGLPCLAVAQISGRVQGYYNDSLVVLPGANVYWADSEVGTTTNSEGYYEIERTSSSASLVVSFIGYETQTKVVISRQGEINFILPENGSKLTEVEIIARMKATTVDLNAADLSFKITTKELRKAACCNLSESFETNASVDISFTDPVSGQRQIEMLGLSGKYALVQRENIPYARGLNVNTGLGFTPGPFVESIQLTKGLSSVLNGYESLTGQINIELYKPETAPSLLFNAFANQGGRFEANVIAGVDVNQRLSTAVLAHYDNSPFPMDRNEDNFADMPVGSQANILNRWHWRSKGGSWEGQVGFMALQDERRGGQLADLNDGTISDSLWQFSSESRRYEVFGKNGYVFKDNDYHSFGIIYSFNYQEQASVFGERQFNSEQSSFYLNSIYQDQIGSPKHRFRTGLSLIADDYTESLSNAAPYQHSRLEIVPGAYLEYDYEPNPKVTLVAGVRADYNSYFEKIYVTPRVNLRYSVTEKTTLRIGGGRGQRTPNLINENLNLLASQRQVNAGSGLTAPEVGWNIGASVVKDFILNDRAASFTVDGFYTWFDSKLIADLDFDRLQAFIFSNSGSRSLSLLTQFDYNPSKGFDIRLAYKYLMAEDNFIDGLDQSYFIPKHRAFVNLAFESKKLWKYDLTLNWFGSRRLPLSEGAPSAYQRDEWSPDFFTVNAQINKSFKNGLELFVGCDNLLDLRQLDPIVSAEDPFNAYFDANYAWGPIFGRNIYAGIYLRLDKD